MKRLFFVIFSFLHLFACANMAEPVSYGTLGSRPFTSQFVDVVHEDLRITVDENFNTANFHIEYHINSSKNGLQIPLLFYASEYSDSFEVFLDGKRLEILEIPYELRDSGFKKFKNFSYFFENVNSDNYNNYSVIIEDSPNGGFYVDLNNMVYFETDIEKGNHIITVNYKATKWIDGWDWVNEYSFRYALSPAKYWKSFGTLDLTINASGFPKTISTNVGLPSDGNLETTSKWSFSEIPTEVLLIYFKPEISSKAKTLIKIGPRGLAIYLGTFMLLIHLILTFFYRKKFPDKHYSLVVIAGSIVIPLIFIISWIMFYGFIDKAIGIHASREHGYSFFVIALYPVITPIYWVIMWGVDKAILMRRK